MSHVYKRRRERERESFEMKFATALQRVARLAHLRAGWAVKSRGSLGGGQQRKGKKKDQKHSNLYLDINSWIFFFFSGRSVCNERCHGAEIHRQHIQCFLLYSVERERGGGLLSCSSEQTHRGGGPFQFHDGGGGGQASSREEDGKSS